MSFYPYLSLNGDCRKAFTRYREIFGGELEVMGMDQMPTDAAAAMPPLPDGAEDLVMHAALTLPDGGMLMGSDNPSGASEGMRGIYVSHSTPDAAAAERIFAALADGGQVIMPIGETFWSPRFGMCVDRFGTPWMIDARPADG